MSKTSILNYRDLLKKINSLNSLNDRVPYSVSDTFLKSLSNKHSKVKKSK
jgi:hypothetical protein